jgi:tellurite resistance protein
MFENDSFRKREQALEDEFFHRVDEKLRQQLREKMEREEAREMLVKVTRFKKPELLDHLLDAGINASSIPALTMLPSIFVAWADGQVSEEERQTVIREAFGLGVDPQQVSFQLIEGWLQHRPPQSMWELWREYAEGVRQSMGVESARQLLGEIHELATAVAKASGGHFGFGKISKAEQKLLDEIQAVCP